MAFRDILGQDHAIRAFKKILANNRLAHAYIFLGTDGIGKSLFAKELAKGLNCKEKIGDACDICIRCRRIENKVSTDVHWFSVKREKKLLGIEEIKELQYLASLKPVESKYRVFILQDAGKLSEDASNCLLKILEEPPHSSIIILLVNALDSLSETVISRCQIIRFFNLSEDIIQTLLRDKYKVNDGSVGEWSLRVANGSINYAVDIIEDYSRYELIINRISRLRPVDNFDLARDIMDRVSDKGKAFEEKRLYVRRVLNLILYYYRDVLVYKYGFDDNFCRLENHYKDLLRRQSELLSLDDIMKIIGQIFITFDYLDANANIVLLLENLLSSIARVSTISS